MVVHSLDGLELQVQGSLQADGTQAEQLVELGVELLVHPLDIGNAQGQHSRVLESLDGELPDEVVVLLLAGLDHVFQVHLLLDCSEHEVNLAEVVTGHDFDVHNVLLEWQHKACVAFGRKNISSMGSVS